MFLVRYLTIVIILACLLVQPATGQDLEPRRWTPIPLGVNFIGVGTAVSAADIAYEPVYQVEDAKLKLRLVGTSFITAFKVADKLARFDVSLPWAHAKWDGLLEGEQSSLKRVGLLDPTFRVSINLLGGPPLTAKKLRQYLSQKQEHTLVGAAVAVTVPWGEYFNDKVINLGNNRYTIRPQIGILHRQGPWSYELTGSMFFYTDNNSFNGGKRKQQQPLYAVQGHIIRQFPAGKWLSFSSGYATGSRTKVDEKYNNDKKYSLLSALSFGMPISKSQSIKVAYLYQQSNGETGADSDSLIFGWSTRF